MPVSKIKPGDSVELKDKARSVLNEGTLPPTGVVTRLVKYKTQAYGTEPGAEIRWTDLNRFSSENTLTIQRLSSLRRLPAPKPGKCFVYHGDDWHGARNESWEESKYLSRHGREVYVGEAVVHGKLCNVWLSYAGQKEPYKESFNIGMQRMGTTYASPDLYIAQRRR